MNCQSCDYEKTALEIVALELGWAKAKHPERLSEVGRIVTMVEELGEVAQAVQDGESPYNRIMEAAQVAVTAIRFIEEQLQLHPNIC